VPTISATKNERRGTPSLTQHRQIVASRDDIE
jgi:hypothetical protein